MGSATVRRIAFVAAILLLAPAWCRPGAVAQALQTPGRALVGLAPAGAGTVPAIRRHASGAWWTSATRPDHGRALATVGFLGLLWLAGLVPWARLEAVRLVLSSLGRRRHAISLRAPPLACCV